MNNDLEKLKTIFLSDEVDAEDYQDNLDKINEWEQSLVSNENIKGWQDHDITREIVQRAKESHATLSLLLATDRKLTDTERASIYARQDAMVWMISIASESPEQVIAGIQDDIKKALQP